MSGLSGFTLDQAKVHAKAVADECQVAIAVVKEQEGAQVSYGWCPESAVMILYGPMVLIGQAKVVQTFEPSRA